MTLNQYGNASPYSNGSNYAPPRDAQREADSGGYETARDGLPDDKMDRIRDLILGDLRRHWDARLHTLETRLQMLEDKVDALRHETAASREDHLTALAQGIDELGQHVRRLSR